MNPVTAAAFLAAAVFAVGDWVSRRERPPSPAAQRLEHVCKPATMIALVVAAGALDPAAGAGPRRAWFVVALGCSLAGDVLLMLPRERFVAGLGAFLVAHLCYLAGFWTRGPSAAALVAATAAVVVVVGALGSRVLPGARGQNPALAAPVAAYMVVIGAMLATAVASGNAAAAAGAALFVASDSMIAWDRFVGRVPAGPLLIMVTYHLGQAALVASLLR